MNAVPSMSPEEYAARFRMIDPRDELARSGAGSAAYLNPEGTDFETLDEYLTRKEA